MASAVSAERKRPRPAAADASGASAASTPGARPSGDDDLLARLGQGIVDGTAARAQGECTKVYANDGEIEKEHFSPVLVQTNLARRSLCLAVERLGELMVVIPAEKILSASAKEFASADLQDGAADDASHEERLEFVHDVLERY